MPRMISREPERPWSLAGEYNTLEKIPAYDLNTFFRIGSIPKGSRITAIRPGPNLPPLTKKVIIEFQTEPDRPSAVIQHPRLGTCLIARICLEDSTSTERVQSSP